jgi:hypothetical protein
MNFKNQSESKNKIKIARAFIILYKISYQIFIDEIIPNPDDSNLSHNITAPTPFFSIIKSISFFH